MNLYASGGIPIAMKTKSIDIGNGHSTKVSAEDFEYLSKFKWNCQETAANRTYKTRYAFASIAIGRKKVQARIGMHRVVLSRAMNDPMLMIQNNREVDHIDHDGLNNCRDNLRPCSPSENQIHKRLQRNNKFGFKGVGFFKKMGKYYVRFTVNGGGRVFGGYFDTPEQAAAKYNEMAVVHFGKFAILNDVEVGHRTRT